MTRTRKRTRTRKEEEENQGVPGELEGAGEEVTVSAEDAARGSLPAGGQIQDKVENQDEDQIQDKNQDEASEEVQDQDPKPGESGVEGQRG